MAESDEFKTQLENVQQLLGLRKEQQIAAEKARQIGSNTYLEQVATTDAVLDNDKKLKTIRDTLESTRQGTIKGVKRNRANRAFDFALNLKRTIDANRIRKKANRIAGKVGAKNLQEFTFQTDYLSSLVLLQQDTIKGLGLLSRLMQAQLASAKQGGLQALEDGKEQKALLKRLAAGGTGRAKGVKSRVDFDALSVKQIILRTLPFIIGFAIAFFSELGVKIRDILKLKRLKTVLRSAFRPITNLGRAIKDIVGKGGTGKFLKANTYKIFGKQTKSFAKFIGRVKKFFRAVVKPFSKLKFPKGQGIGKVGKFLKSILRFFGKVTGLSKFAGPLTKGGKLFGRLLSKFILPITLLVEGLVGFFKRFNSEQLADAGLGTKLLGGFLGAIEGVIKGFIGFPLDLIKDGLAWVLGKFGMDDIAEKMKNFSFVEGITKIFDNIIGFFTGLFGKKEAGLEKEGDGFLSRIGQAIKDFFTSIGDKISGVFSPIIDFMSRINGAITAGIKALAPGGATPKEAFMAALNTEPAGGSATVGAKISAGAEAVKDAAAGGLEAATAAVASAADSVRTSGRKATQAAATDINNVTYNVQGHQEDYATS